MAKPAQNIRLKRFGNGRGLLILLGSVFFVTIIFLLLIWNSKRRATDEWRKFCVSDKNSYALVARGCDELLTRLSNSTNASLTLTGSEPFIPKAIREVRPYVITVDPDVVIIGATEPR